MIKDDEFPLDKYILEINKKNDTESVIYVTTEDFKLKDVQTGSYLSDANIKKIFPPTI